jgi:hypothetical protein
MSRYSVSSEDEIRESLRQYVIGQTGTQDPSPLFVERFLATQSTAPTKDPTTIARELAEKHPLPLDTAAASSGYKPDYTVASLAGLDPNDPLAKQIVQALMGIEDASPAFIQDYMRNHGLPIGRASAPSPEPLSDHKIYTDYWTYICPCEVDDSPIENCPHIEGDVTVLEDEPGVNDIGAGGVRAGPRTRSSGVVKVPISPQDRVACWAEWEALKVHQPNGVVSLSMMKKLKAFSEEVLAQLPDEFYTTITGMSWAFEDIEELRVEDVDAAVNALAVRGGWPPSGTGVVYAEELTPYVMEGEEGYDAKFWATMEWLRSENRRNGIVDLLAWAAV